MSSLDILVANSATELSYMTKEKILPILLLAFLKNICSKKEYDERNAKNDNEMEKNNKENYFSKSRQK